jgi:hypothetical protein
MVALDEFLSKRANSLSKRADAPGRRVELRSELFGVYERNVLEALSAAPFRALSTQAAQVFASVVNVPRRDGLRGLEAMKRRCVELESRLLGRYLLPPMGK